VCGLLLECVTCTPVAPNLGLERDVLLKVEGFVDEHGKWLVFEEEVFFFGMKNTTGVWVLVGSEVTGFNCTAMTMRREDLGEQGQEVILDEGDGDLGSAIKRCDVAVVGVQDPTRARVDADEGSVVGGCATSFDEVVDEVVDGHDDSRVVDFGDRGCAAANVVDLPNELFGGGAEVVVDRFWDQLWVERWDWEDWGGSVDCVDFVAVATDEGVLLRELFERGREGDPEDPACLRDHGHMLCGHLLVRL
jgi:hypothetical protein